jgi:RNA polymerase primary sigma factor
MEVTSNHKAIIDELYAEYRSKGFIQEDEALSLMAAHSLSLQETERITGILLGMGVIFGDNREDDDDDVDRTRTDYDVIFNEVLSISPNTAPLIAYIQEVRPPQYREWHTLIPQAQNGNLYARNRLFDMYLRNVVRLALNAYKNDGWELDELIQEGALGLLRAVKRYDSGKHGSFVSYLPWWVTQYMSRAIGDKSRLIRIPIHALESLRNLNSKINELNKVLGHEPTALEIAEYSGLSEDEVNNMRKQTQLSISLDELLEDESDGYDGFDISDEQSDTLFDLVSIATLRETIDDVLKTLKDREEEVMRLRFGLDDDVERTLEEVGAQFGVTRERIRQIEAKALRRLRHPMRSSKFKGYFDVLVNAVETN